LPHHFCHNLKFELVTKAWHDEASRLGKCLETWTHSYKCEGLQESEFQHSQVDSTLGVVNPKVFWTFGPKCFKSNC
jgi:hypothetical protein